MQFRIELDDFPSPEHIAEWRDKIASLKEYARKNLNDWERGFLDSVEAQLASTGVLTRGQRERLEGLHAEHLGD